MIRRPLAITLALLLVSVPAARATAPVPADRLSRMLSAIAQGRDPGFGTAVAPALSVDAASPAPARATAVIARIARDIEAVTSAFVNAEPADKIAATRAAMARLSSETAQDGASRSFEGDSPSISVMRQLLFVPTTPADGDAVSRVMEIIGAFERSPKPEDTYYEYADPRHLRTSTVLELPGSAASWTKEARPAMETGKVYALKKCRSILMLGWYCNTQLYQIRELSGSGGDAKLLLTFLHRLPKGADNAMFGDRRAENVVDGYTAVYVVLASGDLVLVYNLGIQSRSDKASQKSLLDAGHKQEYRRLGTRLEAALGIPELPF